MFSSAESDRREVPRITYSAARLPQESRRPHQQSDRARAGAPPLGSGRAARDAAPQRSSAGIRPRPIAKSNTTKHASAPDARARHSPTTVPRTRRAWARQTCGGSGSISMRRRPRPKRIHRLRSSPSTIGARRIHPTNNARFIANVCRASMSRPAAFGPYARPPPSPSNSSRKRSFEPIGR